MGGQVRDSYTYRVYTYIGIPKGQSAELIIGQVRDSIALGQLKHAFVTVCGYDLEKKKEKRKKEKEKRKRNK